MIRVLRSIDWTLFLIIGPLLLAGLFTMKSFGSDALSDYFFWRQIMWIGFGLLAFCIASSIDWRFFYSTGFLMLLYGAGVVFLLALFIGSKTSWFQFSLFSVQPSEFMKLIVVLLLAKYFSRRHIHIAQFRHILVSGIYVAVPAFLVFLQPDFGSSITFFVIWLGVILASGIPFRYLMIVVCTAALLFLIIWFFVFAPYQQYRILTFLNPYIDPRGAGYHILQSQIAVGSGKLFGQGVGYGSQSRLQFLPENETDFIFAAFAEEWGFIGAIILLFLFALLLWRLLSLARASPYNFTRLFSIGFALIIMSHFIIHVGMNIGILPITGLPLSFVSYGGSHMLTLFLAVGIWMNMYTDRHGVGKERIELDM